MTRVSLVALLVLVGCSGSNPDSSKPKAAAEAKAPAAEATPKAEASPKVEAPKVDATKVAEVEPAADPAKLPAEAAPAPAPEPGPPPTEFESDEGLYGYRDADGKEVIPPKYPMAMPFVDQVAGVVSDDGWVFIDRHGRKLAQAFVFDNAADDFVEDRARIVDGDRYGFIASNGRIAVEPTWSFVRPFSGGYAAVCEGCVREAVGEYSTMKGGKWGYVDAAGTLVIPPRFEQAEPFEDGKASVTEGGRSFVIGPDGREVPK